ncbi:hypothetical protein NEUTE2DRAFT_124126 [Neurospora tetrasperma FGSC 2509]|nr:hypothetical protein NEUTE2DRAFT_124126 [Neurospora tetrasperma FGSC 2509]
MSANFQLPSSTTPYLLAIVNNRRVVPPTTRLALNSSLIFGLLHTHGKTRDDPRNRIAKPLALMWPATLGLYETIPACKSSFLR